MNEIELYLVLIGQRIEQFFEFADRAEIELSVNGVTGSVLCVMDAGDNVNVPRGFLCEN